MTANPLTVLRLALPGEPSLRDIAHKIGCSHEQLRRFERGEADLSAEQSKRFAEVARIPFTELRRRYLAVRLELLAAERREVVAEMKRLGVKDPRPRRVTTN